MKVQDRTLVTYVYNICFSDIQFYPKVNMDEDGHSCGTRDFNGQIDLWMRQGDWTGLL